MPLSKLSRFLCFSIVLIYGFLLIRMFAQENQVEAHPANNEFFTASSWEPPLTVGFRPTPSFPSSAWTATNNAANSWNGLTSLRFSLSSSRLPNDFNWYGCYARDWNGLHYTNLSSYGAAGMTSICNNASGKRTSAQIALSTHREWYMGTGSNRGSKRDWWGVIAHEFGHAAGLGHWTGSMCSNYSSMDTMCSNIVSAYDYARSLGSHDKHTLQAAYGGASSGSGGSTGGGGYTGPTGYSFCAYENSKCSFSGTQSVAYGNAGKYYYKTATSSISCNNSTFGDPYVGVGKACYTKATSSGGSSGGSTTSTGSGWKYCATEGQYCSFSGTRSVAYGYNQWVTKTLTGGTWCTNAVFGDPQPGTKKQCHVWY